MWCPGCWVSAQAYIIMFYSSLNFLSSSFSRNVLLFSHILHLFLGMVSYLLRCCLSTVLNFTDPTFFTGLCGPITCDIYITHSNHNLAVKWNCKTYYTQTLCSKDLRVEAGRGIMVSLTHCSIFCRLSMLCISKWCYISL